ncbi:hypothetical protein [Paenibacillus sp. TY11]|uniref:hypothetical protein n=1 Tax=Paenibacillus sp. TY11 TaxID=3448633 RepID=UPI004039F7E4
MSESRLMLEKSHGINVQSQLGTKPNGQESYNNLQKKCINEKGKLSVEVRGDMVEEFEQAMNRRYNPNDPNQTFVGHLRNRGRRI